MPVCLCDGDIFVMCGVGIERGELILGERGFWDKASKLFEADKDKVIPVFNSKMELCYFAKWDRKLEPMWKKLSELDRHVYSGLYKTFENYRKCIHGQRYVWQSRETEYGAKLFLKIIIRFRRRFIKII